MRDWFTKDFGWKLFSLFLAVAIWLTVHKIYEEPGTASGLAGGYPVTFANLPVLVVSAAADVRDFHVTRHGRRHRQRPARNHGRLAGKSDSRDGESDGHSSPPAICAGAWTFRRRPA